VDLTLYSGRYAFARGGVGSTGTVVLGIAEMASWPFEPTWLSRRNRGRTDSGARYCYTHWENKRRWPLHFAGETRETTAMMASFFNSTATFFFMSGYGNPVEQSAWYEVVSVGDEWAPKETYTGLFSFEVAIEEV
jgi:hypothetical protein